MIDNYHLPRKNASYHIVILHGHLWGGRFQVAVIWERRVTSENSKCSGRGPPGQEAGYLLDILAIPPFNF